MIELQPPGKDAPSNLSFPSTKEHFDILKSLGPDRSLVKVFRYVTDTKPRKVTGFKLEFKGGKTSLLGKEAKDFDANTLTDTVCIELSKPVLYSDSDGRYRSFYFKNPNSECNESFLLWSPLYTEEEERILVVPELHDLVGMSLTTDSEGFITWCNFYAWPRLVPIL